jgi:hypothetical protein
LKRILLTLVTPLFIIGCNNEKDLMKYDVQCKVEVIRSYGFIDTLNYKESMYLRSPEVKLRYSGRNDLFLNYKDESFFTQSYPLAFDLLHYKVLEIPKATLINE